MVNVGEAANDSERFKNLKAELSWGLRKRFEDDAIEGLTDKTLIEQILSIRWMVNERGQTYIESKDKLKKSPDYFDAMVLAYSHSGNPEIAEYKPDSVDRPLTAGLSNMRF